MINLPLWVLPDKFPSIYESESFTAIEMTSKLYGAMKVFVDEYNKFAKETNEQINTFMESTHRNYDEFTLAMRQEFQDFIDTVELKLLGMDKEIDDAISYMKNNIGKTISDLLREMKEQGELNDVVLESFDGLNNVIEGLRFKIMGMNNSLRDIDNHVDTMKSRNKCKISGAEVNSYITIRLGSGLPFRVTTDPSASNYLQITNIDGYSILSNTIFSTNDMTKTINGVYVDNKTSSLDALHDTSLEFNSLIIDFTSTSSKGVNINTTIVVEKNRFIVFENVPDDYDGSVATGIVGTQTAEKCVRIHHGSHAKIFTNNTSESLRRFVVETVDVYGKSTIKSFESLGVL